MAQQQLSGVLLDFASRLRALAIDGIVEREAVALKAELGMGPATLRTLRARLAALEAAGVITRESGRGPGARLRLAFVGERRKEIRKVAEVADGVAEEAETEGGRGEAVQLHEAPKEKAAEAAREKRREAEGVAETVVRHVHEIHAAPELVALLRSLTGGRVSPGKPAVEFVVEDASADEEELVLERFEQLKEDGTPVKKPQVMRALVLGDIRKDSGMRAALQRSMQDRRAAREQLKNEKTAAEKARAENERIKRELVESARAVKNGPASR